MLVSGGYYTGRPDRVRAIYMIGGAIAGGVLAAASGSLMTAFGMQPAAGIVAGIVSGVIIVLFGWFMPSRTVRGTRELEKVLGFQEFLSRVEGDRLDRVVKTPEMFEKFLPYAMALGVEARWAKAFEGIYKEPPQWYTAVRPACTRFSRGRSRASLGVMSTQAASAMASSPREQRRIRIQRRIERRRFRRRRWRRLLVCVDRRSCRCSAFGQDPALRGSI